MLCILSALLLVSLALLLRFINVGGIDAVAQASKQLKEIYALQ